MVQPHPSICCHHNYPNLFNVKLSHLLNQLAATAGVCSFHNCKEHPNHHKQHKLQEEVTAQTVVNHSGFVYALGIDMTQA